MVSDDEYVCQEDWYRFGSFCYFAVNTTATFGGAVEWCETQFSGTLAKITNDEESKFVACESAQNTGIGDIPCLCLFSSNVSVLL